MSDDGDSPLAQAQKLYETGEISEENVVLIEAFATFLRSGKWIDDNGKRRFVVDKNSYNYALGKISAEEYLTSQAATLDQNAQS